VVFPSERERERERKQNVSWDVYAEAGQGGCSEAAAEPRGDVRGMGRRDPCHPLCSLLPHRRERRAKARVLDALPLPIPFSLGNYRIYICFYFSNLSWVFKFYLSSDYNEKWVFSICGVILDISQFYVIFLLILTYFFKL
jgi:hypothetical protein